MLKVATNETSVNVINTMYLDSA